MKYKLSILDGGEERYTIITEEEFNNIKDFINKGAKLIDLGEFGMINTKFIKCIIKAKIDEERELSPEKTLPIPSKEAETNQRKYAQEKLLKIKEQLKTKLWWK